MNDFIQQYSDVLWLMPYVLASVIAAIFIGASYVVRLIGDMAAPDPSAEEDEYDLSFYAYEGAPVRKFTCGLSAARCVCATKH